MSITTNSTKEKIWDALISAGVTVAGAAGIMGNLQAESVGCLPSRVQALLIQRYKEEGFHSWPYGLYDQKTSQLYTKEVDEGTISKAEFLSPRQYTGKSHQYGYGLAQWTTKARKERLWSFTKEKGKSIADAEGQIECLIYELKNIFPSVWDVVSKTSSVETASDIVLTKFEAPANANSLKTTRRGYSKEYYELYKNRKNNTIKQQEEKKDNMGRKITVKEILERASAYVGYEQKKSNKDLESFHANKGAANYQKFQPLAGAGNGDEWCQYFVDGIFVETAGSIKNAQKLLYMDTSKSYMTGYTPQGKEYFVKAKRWYTTPQPGDVIYFYSSGKGRVGHTGLVEKVDTANKVVYTIEGNTRVDTYAENGGCVARHSYSYKSIGGTNRVNGFGRPNYEGVEVNTAAKPLPNRGSSSTEDSSSSILEKGSFGAAVKTLQTMLNACGYNCGDVDGDFGSKTDSALRAFQKAHGLVVDGEYGPKSKAALEAVYKAKQSSSTPVTPAPADSSASKTIPVNTSGVYNESAKGKGRVNVHLLNVRKGPGAQYSNLVSYPTISANTQVDICDAVKNPSTGVIWYFIGISGNKGYKRGFVNSNYIDII